MKRLMLLLLVLVLGVAISFNVFGEAKKITLKFADNIPDRNHAWGAVIEKINAEFLKKHPNVEIETESLQDQPYQQKIKIYAASNQLPDLFKYWSFSSMLPPLVNNGYLMPLDRKEFEEFDWLPGALEANMVNGKLYGLPVTADFWFIYYNKALFEKYNVKVPTTFKELYAAAKVFRDNGVIPAVTDGKDAWPLCITLDNIFWRQTGDYGLVYQAFDRKLKFTAPEFVNAAKTLREWIDKGVFNDDVLTTDYGAAKNLFGQEKAAMYIMGTWEMGMSTDTSFSEHFRDNLAITKFPVTENGKGDINDLFAWYGGNYVVNSKTKHKELCIDYLKTYFTLYPTLTWEIKATLPAQRIQPTPEDNEVAKTVLAIANSAKRTAGPARLDLSTDEFKQLDQKYVTELVAGIKTPEEWAKAVDAAAEKAAKKK